MRNLLSGCCSLPCNGLLGLAFGPLLGTAVAASPGGTDFGRAFVAASLLCGAAGAGMLLLRRWERRVAR